jgi:hypothetical protein
MLKIIFPFFLIVLVACNTNVTDEALNVTETKSELPKLVPFDSLNFIINQPIGWDYKIKLKGADLLMVDNACDSCLVKPVVMVLNFSNKDTLTLKESVAENIKTTSEFYKEFKLINQTELDLNGLPAERVEYTALNRQNDSIGVINYYVLKADKVYFINCMDINSNNAFASKVQFFDEVCKTFKFKEN